MANVFLDSPQNLYYCPLVFCREEISVIDRQYEDGVLTEGERHNKVIDIWQPTADDKVIINLPVTVSHSMPHVYANQVEYMHKN